MLIWVKWNGINYFLFNTNYKDKRDDDLLHLILLFSIGSLKIGIFNFDAGSPTYANTHAKIRKLRDAA